MAASGFGALGLKVHNLDFGCVRPKLTTLKPLHSLGTPKIVRFDDLVLSRRSKKLIDVRRSSASEDNANVDNNSKKTNSTDAVSSLIPSASEVQSLLTMLCDTTSIAEFELKLGGFQLYVSRDLADQGAPPFAPASSPATTHSVIEIPGPNGLASSTSLALSKPTSSSLLDQASDEALALLKSPRVGYFRRSRTIKGKRAPPACKEKDVVKEGQVLCYIEQLGGEIPVESDISGEVVKILKEDGDPVGYGDALIAVLPSFPGVKKLK